MGRSISENFKRRFGDPPRIEIKYETKKASFDERAHRNQKMVEATIDVLRGILGREPTQAEILGEVDISKTILSGKKATKGKA